MQNRTMRAAHLLGRLVIVLCALLYLAFFCAFVYWHFDRMAFQMVDLREAFNAGFGFDGVRLYTNDQKIPSNAVLMSDISRGMLYWLCLRMTLFFALTILITRSALQILRSISNLSTFYRDNPHHFKSIAFYSLIAFVFSTFNFFTHKGSTELYLKTAFGPLILAVAALVLAEVFKEGKKLLEEQNLII